VTAKDANHAQEGTDREFPSRIWRISRLNLFASCRRPLSDLYAPAVKIRAKTKPIRGGARGAWDARQLCQTNPIPSPAGCAEAWGRATGRCRTNKPNSPMAPAAMEFLPCPSTLRSPASAGPGVRNKPTWHRRDGKDKSSMGKELWLIEHAKDFGKTKPIPRRSPVRRGHRGEGRQSRVPPRGSRSCDNAPLPGVVPATMPIVQLRIGAGLRQDACRPTCRPTSAPADCAKQSQFDGNWLKEKRLWWIG
jgi:hypothetical protein